MMNIILFILLVVLIVLTIVGFILQNKLLKHIKSQHNELWIRIGKPTLFLNNSLQSGLIFTKLVFGNEYAIYNDPKLTGLCKINAKVMIFQLSLFLCVLFLILAKIKIK